LGCGIVGGGVAELLLRDRTRIEALTGVRYNLKGIAVRSVDKRRDIHDVPHDLFTSNAGALVADPDVDLVIECIGGRDAAGELVERALESRKHVVSANKELLATDGPRLFALAASGGVTLQYEAAVAAAIPIVRVLAESLAGDEVREVAGILNGTTNFILSSMHDGKSYAEALAQAQELGFAESDPTNDVDGIDSSHKLAILCQLAFRSAVTSPRIARRGITNVSVADIERAQRLNCAVKLLGVARYDNGELSAEIAPVFVPELHPFARAQGAENCVRVVGRSSGPLTFYGQGAGRFPSASAVIGDIVAAMRTIAGGRTTARHHHAKLHAAGVIKPAYDAFEKVRSEGSSYPVWREPTASATDDRPAVNA
jgi:homoserine dehydrogenase